MKIILTVDQIKDLALFAGLIVKGKITKDDKETEIAIGECPKKGVKDEDGKTLTCRHIAWLEEYPEEGVFPLGPTQIKQSISSEEGRK